MKVGAGLGTGVEVALGATTPAHEPTAVAEEARRQVQLPQRVGKLALVLAVRADDPFLHRPAQPRLDEPRSHGVLVLELLVGTGALVVGRCFLMEWAVKAAAGGGGSVTRGETQLVERDHPALGGLRPLVGLSGARLRHLRPKARRARAPLA